MSRIDDEVTYWCRKYGSLDLGQVIRGAMDWARSDAEKENASLREQLVECQEAAQIMSTGTVPQEAYDAVWKDNGTLRARLAASEAELKNCQVKFKALRETLEGAYERLENVPEGANLPVDEACEILYSAIHPNPSQRDVALFGPDGTGIATGASASPSQRDEEDKKP